MRPDEYGFLTAGTCPYCGAGFGNNYKHDESCLINLPDHRPLFIEAWKKGRKDYLATKGRVPDAAASDMGDNTVKAYVMGITCVKNHPEQASRC